MNPLYAQGTDDATTRALAQLAEIEASQQRRLKLVGDFLRILEADTVGGAEADYARFYELEARLTEKAAQS